MPDKLKINREATLHKLTSQDEASLKIILDALNREISLIIKRDELPEANWLPSDDLKFLIRRD